MTPFSNQSPAERALVINEAASRLGLSPLIIEKDFWVCWTLARIFTVEAIAPHVVFKGGTSLSKVFGAIQRFSEDIDLAVSPRALGFETAELDEAPSASQRRKRVQALEAECERCVAGHKSRFFSSGWTHYETARPGTFRLVPPQSRHAALARDYATMAPMFIGSPIEFDVLLQHLQAAEQQLNDGNVRCPT